MAAFDLVLSNGAKHHVECEAWRAGEPFTIFTTGIPDSTSSEVVAAFATGAIVSIVKVVEPEDENAKYHAP